MRTAHEAKQASRRSQEIANEATRRIQGLDPRPYPTASVPNPLGPAAMILLGVATVAFASTGLKSGTTTSAESTAASTAPELPPSASARTTNRTTALMVRERPTTVSAVVGELDPATEITVVCWSTGQPVDRDGTVSDVWHRVSQPSLGWVSGQYVAVLDEERPC